MNWLFRSLAGRGAESRLTILIFHRVMLTPDDLFPGEMHRGSFDQVCAWVRRWFTVLPLGEAVRRLSEGRLPPGALAITFDDGYADNHDVALPVLERYGLNATFFVATGFLDGGRMWNDTLVEAIRCAQVETLDLRAESTEVAGLGVVSLRSLEDRRKVVHQLILQTKYLDPAQRLAQVHRIAALTRAQLPSDLMMTTRQVAALHQAGMCIGAHTKSHPILTRLSDAEARLEIEGSRDRLSEITGSPVELFAYPNGKAGSDYTARDVDLVRELGFLAAFSTTPGVATATSGSFELPRYTPWRRRRLGFAAQLALNLRRTPLNSAAQPA